MELHVAQSLAIDLMDKHGLISMGWKFKFDKAKRRFGVCRYGPRIISLSAAIVKLNPQHEVEDTIKHEIAHALTRGHHHDAVWKAKCVEIGCRPERCYSSNNVISPDGKFTAICPACNRVFKRHKKPAEDIKRSCHCQRGIPWVSRKLLVFKNKFATYEI